MSRMRSDSDVQRTSLIATRDRTALQLPDVRNYRGGPNKVAPGARYEANVGWI